MKSTLLKLALGLSFLASAAHGNSLSGEYTNVAWALEQQFTEGLHYNLEFEGFSSARPEIIAVDSLDLSADDSREMGILLAERYKKCIDVKIDDASRTVTVSPRDLKFVRSQHVTNSTYSVDGQESFSLVTENATKERYFCLYNTKMIKSEWQKRAFADVLRSEKK